MDQQAIIHARSRIPKILDRAYLYLDHNEILDVYMYEDSISFFAIKKAKDDTLVNRSVLRQYEYLLNASSIDETVEEISGILTEIRIEVDKINKIWDESHKNEVKDDKN